MTFCHTTIKGTREYGVIADPDGKTVDPEQIALAKKLGHTIVSWAIDELGYVPLAEAAAELPVGRLHYRTSFYWVRAVTAP
jgi:hypothetical protein